MAYLSVWLLLLLALPESSGKNKHATFQYDTVNLGIVHSFISIEVFFWLGRILCTERKLSFFPISSAWRPTIRMKSNSSGYLLFLLYSVRSDKCRSQMIWNTWSSIGCQPTLFYSPQHAGGLKTTATSKFPKSLEGGKTVEFLPARRNT